MCCQRVHQTSQVKNMGRNSSEYMKEYAKTHKEEIDKAKKKHWNKTKDRVNEERRYNYKTDKNYRDKVFSRARKNTFKYDYNLTIEKYNEILQQQGSRCAICGIYQSQLDKNLSVDHNHETGKIRGLLCSKCNFAIGLFNDSKDLLHRAIGYLEKSG